MNLFALHENTIKETPKKKGDVSILLKLKSPLCKGYDLINHGKRLAS
jgi:hypothetical protein